MEKMAKKVLIDCDPGVDDALALILALHSPELKVLGISAVSGNVPVEMGFANIKKVLSFLQPRGKPLIARGAEAPLRGNPLHAFHIHGANGLRGAKIPQGSEREAWQIFPDRADKLLTTTARHHPGEVALIALGPLTNLALALQRDPGGMRMLAEVIAMGGAVRSPGNITPQAEFNFFADPQAARMVCESGLPLTIVPLDVTHQVFLRPQLIKQELQDLHADFGRLLRHLTGYNRRSGFFPGGGTAFYLHDPLAVGVAARPALVKKERLRITVVTRRGESYGRSFEPRPPSRRGGQVDVCLEVDADKFIELFLARLEH